MENSLKNDEFINPFKVISVDGFAMLLNKKKFVEDLFFDENFFMYLENDDLCKRVICDEGSIFIIPKAKINHVGASAVNPKFNEEVELSRNWHWIWSKFYFNKKHHGYLKAFLLTFLTLITSAIKSFYYLITINKYKKKIYMMRFLGLLNSMLVRKSWYRPKI